MRRLACEELEARRLLAPIVTGVDPGGYEDDPAGFAAVQNVATQSLPVLSIADVTMAEGNSGTKTFTFTVSMSGSNPSGASVDYQTINWSATTADNDYVAASGALTWSPGDTSPKTIDVTVNGDTTSEPDETFYVVLDMADGADLLDGLGQGTISNDDFVPTLSMNNAWILEGDSGTQTLTLTVNVSGTNPSGASVNYRTADETATTADNDYVAASGKLTWAPGDTSSRTISVTVNGDTTFEGSDSFLVELFGGSGVILPLFPARGTIENDDDAFFSIDDVSVSEGDSGTKTFTFTVSFSGGIYARFANIDYATADGAATTAGNDYVAASGKLTWVAGDPSPKLVSVTVNGDTTYEPDETFYVNLSRPRGGVISDGQGTGLIRNDDASPLPALSIDDAGITEGDSGTKTLTFTVSMSGSNPSGASVNFATADGAATTAGNDYLAAAGSLTWAAGDTAAKSISVTVNGDTAFEPNETFYVDLSGPAGANISDSQGLGTIQNDDAQPLGTVDFLVLDSLDLSGGEVWLGLTTAHGGWLTLLTQTPGAQIALYDSSLVHRADSAAVDGNQRLDEAVSAAESFYVQLRGAGPAAELRIANLL
ncbi:MAG: hypothetical protein HUU20_07365, partial [Pirellulales bacterium]|nr:hypothetical protein [Pirellulales bacterium]